MNVKKQNIYIHKISYLMKKKTMENKTCEQGHFMYSIIQQTI
jgi:hypothetical protein